MTLTSSAPELDATTFEAGEGVDVSAHQGKGFAGVMKRHGFAGVSASVLQPQARLDRRRNPGRIFKGRMAVGGLTVVLFQNLTDPGPVQKVPSSAAYRVRRTAWS